MSFPMARLHALACPLIREDALRPLAILALALVAMLAGQPLPLP